MKWTFCGSVSILTSNDPNTNQTDGTQIIASPRDAASPYWKVPSNTPSKRHGFSPFIAFCFNIFDNPALFFNISCTLGILDIIACAKTDRVVGARIIGADAGTMIAEIVAYMEFGGAAEDIARTCHAHPTLNEAIK